MKWDDDLELSKVPLARAQYQLAMFAAHLAEGNSIYCRSIKLAAIKAYVRHVASFIALFQGCDIRKDNPTDKNIGKVLTTVFDEIERYEKIPDRQEPYTPEMHNRVVELAQQAHPNSINAALRDWFEFGLLHGPRRCEWAQDQGHYNLDKPQYIEDTKEPYAFLPIDVRVYTSSRRYFDGLDALQVPFDQWESFDITHRHQKNKQHGEKKLHSRNRRRYGRCAVAAMRRIMERYAKLVGTDRIFQHTIPLAVFWDAQSRSTKYITADEVQELMRSVAAELYHINPDTTQGHTDLQRWSSHSLRVGACVLLYQAGFTETQIKHILRWKSNCFMDYLQNLLIIADRHNRAFDEASGMPNVL
jgi:hypothetical protein